jgi:hypothetical protein
VRSTPLGHLKRLLSRIFARFLINTLRTLVIIFLGSSVQVASADVAFKLIDDIYCVGGRFGLMLPQDIRAVKRMSKLRREEISEIEKWDGYTATRKTLYFDGLALGVIEFSNDPARYLLTSADLMNSSWNRISQFKLRKPAAEAVKLIGERARLDPELNRTYGGESDSVQFQTSAGVLTRVTYSCYSG